MHVYIIMEVVLGVLWEVLLLCEDKGSLLRNYFKPAKMCILFFFFCLKHKVSDGRLDYRRS